MLLRRASVIICLSLFLAGPVAAQGIPGLSSVGVKGGLSLATLRADDTAGDIGYDTGFVGGIYGQVGFTPFISPRAEVLYVQKGGSVEGVGTGQQDASYNVDYIEIPVLFKVSVPIVRQVFPSLYLGPYLSFAVNRSITVEGEDIPDFNGEDAFESTDYGLVIGTDVDIPFAGQNFVLSGRYDWGLANIANDEGGTGGDISTGTFMLTIGVGL